MRFINFRAWIRTGCSRFGPLMIGGAMICTSCANEADRPGRFSTLNGAYPSKPKDYPVEIFQGAIPSRPYVEIARLDVHLESGFFVTPALKDAFPELMYQARRAGADAVINLRERRSSLNETHILHVTATGIKYRE